MNLGDLRAKFVSFSGRYDLVNTDDSDDGANFFINAGQRFLDRRIDFKKSQGVYFKSLAVDGWYMRLSGCRSLEKVWVYDNEERWELEKKDLSWLYKQYPDLVSETDSGDAQYWAPSELRGIRTADKDSRGDYFNHVLAESGVENVSGITILPPTDVALVVELHGKFYSPTLENDEDESYWTEAVPETLLMAALYRLEAFYRNTQGAQDWLGSIELDLLDIDKDGVQEDNANVDQLEG